MMFSGNIYNDLNRINSYGENYNQVQNQINNFNPIQNMNNYNQMHRTAFYPNYTNISVENAKYIIYKCKSSSDFMKVGNFYEIKKNFINRVYIIAKTDFVKLSQNPPNYNNFQSPQNLNNYIKFYSIIEDFINAIMQSNIEFYFIKEEFFVSKGIQINQNDHVDMYRDEDKIILSFAKDNQNNRILELKISNKIQNPIQMNMPNANINYNVNPNESTLRKLILLNAFEKEFINLMKMPIKDEYDTKEFYLINKNIIEKFKNDNIWYKQSPINNYPYSYKGFIKNMPRIIQMNPNILNNPSLNNTQMNSIYTDENNFFPLFNNYWENMEYPYEFILVPETLFDIFYNDFSHHTHKKEDFKFTTLIGNDILFIQNKMSNTIFDVYQISKENGFLEIICSLKFGEEYDFYQEVNNYIKGKSLSKYFNIRKIDLNYANQVKQVYDNNMHIMQYIILKQIEFENPLTIGIRQEINRNLDLLVQYNNFIKNITKLQGPTLKLNNVNDFKNNLNKFQIIKCIIINGKHLKYITNRLYFDKIQNLLYLKNSPNYRNEESRIINEIITNQNNNNDLVNLLNQAIIFDGNKLDKNYNNNSLFGFINLDLIKKIDNSPDIFNKFAEAEANIFKNNNIYYLYYPKTQKIFKIKNFNQSFIAIEEEQLGLNQIHDLLIKLVNDDDNEKDKLKFSIKYMTQSQSYYCINRLWMAEFKKFFCYDVVKMDPKNMDKYQKKMENNKILPRSLYDNTINITPETDTIQNINIGIPKNFELVKSDIFDLILKEINSQYKKNIQIYKAYITSFGGHRIIIQDISNKEIYLMYIKINNNYILDYIISFDDINFNISDLFKKFERSETIEEIFSLYYNIDLSDKKPQSLISYDIKMADLYIIRDKEVVKKKEPNHCLGLQNIGATCYMNATIQCLCHVSKLKEYFLNSQLVMKDTQNKQCALTMEFCKVINNLWKSSFEGKNYYAPNSFKDIISEMNPLFQGIAANDSKDLIIFLYEKIHKELNNPMNQNYQYDQDAMNDNDLQEFRNSYYPKNSSIILDTFYFEHKNMIKCKNCGCEKSNYNIYNILVFPLEKVREFMIQKFPGQLLNITLENCFEHYQTGELLCGTNQIYCNNCRQSADAQNINILYNSPDVLTIILNRGKGLQFDVTFAYPLLLNLQPFVVNNNGKNNNYELICVLSHLGPSGMSGHFIAFCKSPVDGNWYMYNDAMVDKCVDPRYINNTYIENLPYVLFYQRVNDKKGPNMITLYIQYNDKEFYLDVDKTITISDLVNKLQERYEIENNLQLFLKFNHNLIELAPDLVIQNNPNIKDKSVIVAKAY